MQAFSVIDKYEEIEEGKCPNEREDSMMTDEVVEDYLRDGFSSEIASINQNNSHVTATHGFEEEMITQEESLIMKTHMPPREEMSIMN